MPANLKRTTPNTRPMWSIREDSTWLTPTGTALPPQGHRMAGAQSNRVGRAQWRRQAWCRPLPHSSTPPQEFYDCLKEVPALTPNAVARARTPGVAMCSTMRSAALLAARRGDRLRDENVGEVDALREAGGYFALSAGTIHKNSSLVMRMISNLGHAPTCGFECHGPKSRYRGIRLFEFHESNPAGCVTCMLTWGNLVWPLLQQRAARLAPRTLRYRAVSARNELRRPQVVFAVVAGAMSLWLYSHHPPLTAAQPT